MTALPPEENNEQAPQHAAPEPTAGAPAPDAAAAQGFQQPGNVPPVGDPQQHGYAPPAGGYQQPGYQQPQQPGYAQPQQPGYAQPATDPVSTITLNYWLSVFFSWLPALIFWVLEKDKGNQQATAFHTANLNFSLLRTGVGIVIGVLWWIPILGWIIAALLGIASLALFILHIIAAVSAADNYRRGQAPNFMFNVPLIK